MTLNGRPGLAVSGGVRAEGGRNTTSLRSVEFYDVSSGHWVSLPGLEVGRHSHNMMVEDGRLRVMGGSQAAGRYLRDIETFDGKRWEKSFPNISRDKDFPPGGPERGED